MRAGRLLLILFPCPCLALLLACTAAYAQQKPASTPDTLPAITVTAMRGTVEKSYRKMIKGMELFAQRRGMAPDASLRFKLLPRKRETDMNRIVLEIVGDTVAIPVPVAPDHTFTLERHQKALDENAVVTPNRRSQSMTWRTEIRTPGLPPDTRRLGDLRLECQVGMEADLISNQRPPSRVIQFLDAITGTVDTCSSKESRYLFFADRPLSSVAMINGARREILPLHRLYAGKSDDPDFEADLPYCDCEVLVDRAYLLPLGDLSWPDDTLVEFEYMEDGIDRQGGRPMKAPELPELLRN